MYLLLINSLTLYLEKEEGFRVGQADICQNNWYIKYMIETIQLLTYWVSSSFLLWYNQHCHKVSSIPLHINRKKKMKIQTENSVCLSHWQVATTLTNEAPRIPQVSRLLLVFSFASSMNSSVNLTDWIACIRMLFQIFRYYQPPRNNNILFFLQKWMGNERERTICMSCKLLDVEDCPTEALACSSTYSESGLKETLPKLERSSIQDTIGDGKWCFTAQGPTSRPVAWQWTTCWASRYIDSLGVERVPHLHALMSYLPFLYQTCHDAVPKTKSSTAAEDTKHRIPSATHGWSRPLKFQPAKRLEQ